jgi:hypothetical protein
VAINPLQAWFIESGAGFFVLSPRKELLMIKVQVLTQCKHCNGEAYLQMGEAEDCQGRRYTRYVPCPMCEGSGNLPSWISLDDFAKLLVQVQCTYEHTSYHGSLRLSAGDVWDDIT